MCVLLSILGDFAAASGAAHLESLRRLRRFILGGINYMYNATCLMRPRLSYMFNSSCQGSPEFATRFATLEEHIGQVVLDKCFPLSLRCYLIGS